MKKRKILKGTVIGAAIAGLTLGGCSVQDVYGPPPDATDEFDPTSMVVEDVYGPPPEAFESTLPEDSDQQTNAAPDTTDDPTDMDEGNLYDPPADPTDEEETETRTSVYRPEDEAVELVYGPPSYFTDND